jgi:hypothetical protein
MSNPTTPFGWQMPTATDLVTDLPADFEVFGQAVATSMADLLGGTTGQILSKTSNTDMDFTWTTPNPGDITGVTAGVGISGGGTSGDVTVTNSMATAITTNGDIIYGTGSGTFSRLGIGSTNQVLKVTGGVPVWGSGGAGNLTEVVFNSSNASYTIPTGVTGIWALVVGSGGGGGASSTATATNSGGAGGAGQAIEKYFSIAGGDTTLNITVAAGGAGGTAGGKGSSGSASSIVGNTSATTYATAAGGGGGGGGAAANTAGIAGASGGGNGSGSNSNAGGGGGMGCAASDELNSVLNVLPTSIGNGPLPTTLGVTGFSGGSSNNSCGGAGINIWGRSICGGGTTSPTTSAGISRNFGAGANTTASSAGSSATANTGAGGNGGKTQATSALAGGNGGSGLVVLRFVS